YHELADLAQTRERVKNHNFAVKEWQGEIIFLRNLLEGAASHSYGIHVARLAGLPPPVIHRAKEILQQLEEGQGRENGFGALAQSGDDRPRQLALFGSLGLKLCETLRKIDVSHMTPLEALNLLSKLSQEAQKTE
ncbi:MAG TPA: DNA mismatch repair protein MutS, partial [Terriglobales bacterium]|nr:DNA mismatch repair protein MutS [Terriglobales bacterium]